MPENYAPNTVCEALQQHDTVVYFLGPLYNNTDICVQ